MDEAICRSVSSRTGIAPLIASDTVSTDVSGLPGVLSLVAICFPPRYESRGYCERWNMISCFPDMYSGLLAPTDRSAAARFFRVLGDPTRLHILELLEQRELTVSELVVAVGQPQPRLTTHLASLPHSDFVTP